MIDLDIKNIPAQIKPLLDRLSRYSVVIFLLGFLGIYTFLVIQVNVLVNSEPGQAEISQQTSGIKQLKIDQDALTKIHELEAQNIEIQALFNDARNNPFSE